MYANVDLPDGRDFVLEPCSAFDGCHVWKVRCSLKDCILTIHKPHGEFNHFSTCQTCNVSSKIFMNTMFQEEDTAKFVDGEGATIDSSER